MTATTFLLEDVAELPCPAKPSGLICQKVNTGTGDISSTPISRGMRDSHFLEPSLPSSQKAEMLVSRRLGEDPETMFLRSTSSRAPPGGRAHPSPGTQARPKPGSLRHGGTASSPLALHTPSTCSHTISSSWVQRPTDL